MLGRRATALLKANHSITSAMMVMRCSSGSFSALARGCSSLNETGIQVGCLDKIHLEGLKFFGRHGVLPEETLNGQHFYVDATLTVDLAAAGRHDDLAQTVSYAEVHSDIQNIVEGPPRQLIESVAEAIAHTVLVRHPLVQSVIVRVDKPHAPIKGDFKTVAVEIQRKRAAEANGC